MDTPRTPEQRKRDALRRLEEDVDAWVATAGPGGGSPYMVPLSFLWDGAAMLIATPETTRTSRNLRAGGKARLGIGPTRDVVLIEGTAHVVGLAELPGETPDTFAAKTGFDPRTEAGSYVYFRIHPVRVQAWRSVAEIPDRDIMRHGQWITP